MRSRLSRSLLAFVRGGHEVSSSTPSWEGLLTEIEGATVLQRRWMAGQKVGGGVAPRNRPIPTTWCTTVHDITVGRVNRVDIPKNGG